MRYRLRRKLLSQNFLYNQTLINFLVRESSVGRNDLVLEIGPGKGFITKELLEVAKQVIAVELDYKLVLHLQKYFSHHSNLKVYCRDFIKFPLPREAYKVFANIPFSVEGKIIRKLLNADNPPNDCYLVVRADLANRLSGLSKENQFSLKYKPWFETSIYHCFKRLDFIPQARMDVVMWRIKKRVQSLLEVKEKRRYQKFVGQGFGQGQNIKYNLKRFLTPDQIKLISQKVSFSLDTKPSYLSFSQWLELYCFIYCVK